MEKIIFLKGGHAMLKRLSIFICTMSLIISMPLTSMAAGWKQDEYGWWWEENDGSYPVSTWRFINYHWYYFNQVGYMETGWVLDDGVWYYLEDSGELRYAPLTEKGLRYYFDETGACTNPEGEPVTVIGGATAETTTETVETVTRLTKDEYLDEADFWIKKLTYASRRVDTWRNSLSNGGHQTVLTEAPDLKNGLWYLNDIDPPESCTELHDTYLYANTNMISALDTYYDLALDLSDGHIDPGTMSDYLDYADEYISIASYHLGNATQMRQSMN